MRSRSILPWLEVARSYRSRLPAPRHHRGDRPDGDPELAARGIKLPFAVVKDPIRARLRRHGALTRVPDQLFFPTVGTAVSGYIRATGESWTDWGEGPSERP